MQLTLTGRWLLFLGLVIGFTLSLIAVAFFRIEVPQAVPTPAPPVIVIHEGSWERSSPQPISDSQGHKAEIETVVLSNDFAWKFQSHTIVQRDDIENANIQEHLTSPGISGSMNLYTDIIAIGAASVEGAAENPQQEEARALHRADQLQLWIKDFIVSKNPLYKLSLGYYKKFSDELQPSATKNQRRVVILGVVRKDKDIDLADALKRSLPKVEYFPFKLNDYSNFLLQRTR